MRSVLICICALLFAGAAAICAQQGAASVDGNNRAWANVENEGKVDLVIAGHWHRFAFFKPGAGGDNFPVLVVGRRQGTDRVQHKVKTIDPSVNV